MRHSTLTVFSAPRAGLDADVDLGVRGGRWRGFGFHPLAAIELRRRLAGLKPDVVVAHGGEPLKYLSVAMPAGARLVYKKIGMYDFGDTGVRRMLYRALVRRCDVVVAVSQEALDEVATLVGAGAGPNAPELRLIPNGRDPALYRRGPGHDEPHVVFVGHLSPEKRPETYVATIQALRDRHIPLQASLVGGGKARPELRRAAEAAGVALLGRREDVPDILSDSDLLLLTSRTEGMPGVLIEAGLSGLPVVTTAVPGARTIVADGSSGLVVPIDDVEALVEATANLVTNAPLRKEMGDAALLRCREQFTLDASVEMWHGLLRGIHN